MRIDDIERARKKDEAPLTEYEKQLFEGALKSTPAIERMLDYHEASTHTSYVKNTTYKIKDPRTLDISYKLEVETQKYLLKQKLGGHDKLISTQYYLSGWQQNVWAHKVKIPFHPSFETTQPKNEEPTKEMIRTIPEEVLKDGAYEKLFNETEALLGTSSVYIPDENIDNDIEKAKYAKSAMILLRVAAERILAHPEALANEDDWRIDGIVKEVSKMKKYLDDVLDE